MYSKQFYFVVSGLKIIGYGNTDNNLESSYIVPLLKIKHYIMKTYGRVKL
jgi:hypothetical protein